MKEYGTLWWTTARHWAEISAYSPFVMGERVLAATLAGPRPGAAQQAEMSRMVMEKGAAAAETAAALWLAAFETQQLAWQRAWRAGRAVPIPADFALSAGTARTLGRAWQPFSRRVNANARRLAAKRRRVR
jgi:hypothetical protein